jgi:hypothetical protein
MTVDSVVPQTLGMKNPLNNPHAFKVVSRYDVVATDFNRPVYQPICQSNPLDGIATCLCEKNSRSAIASVCVVGENTWGLVDQASEKPLSIYSPFKIGKLLYPCDRCHQQETSKRVIIWSEERAMLVQWML